MSDLATLAVRVTSSGIEITNRELEKLGRTAAQAEKQTDNLGRTTSSTSGTFSRFSGILSAAGIGLAARQLADYTDRMAKMQGQLALVTSSHSELNAVYSRALKLANDTGQSLEGTVNLYTKLARSTQDLGLSQDRLFTITQAINQAFVVSGATATEAAAAMHQLSQGLASGTLRGEELNSVMENSPRLARALADGLGVSIGELRRMGAEGELTAEKVTGALERMSSQIDAEFQQMPTTIGRVTQEIKNNLLDAFGSADVGPAIEGLEALSDALADPVMKRSLQDLASMSVDAGVGIASLTAELLKLAAAPFTEIGKGLAWIINKGRDLGIVFDHIDALGVSVTGTAEEIQLAYDKMNNADIKSDGMLAAMDALQKAGAVSKDVAVLTEKINTLKASIADMARIADMTQSSSVRGAMSSAQDELKKLEAQLNQAQKTTKGMGTATEKLSEIVVTAHKRQSTAVSAYEKTHKDAMKKIAEQEQKRAEKVQETTAALDQQLAAIGMNSRAQVIYNTTMDAAKYAHGEELARIVEKTVALYDQQVAIDAAAAETQQAAEKAKQAGEDTAKAAQDAMKPWSDALQGMAENIDRSFVQAWSDAFTGAEDGFKNFARNIWDSFLNLLASMAHLAITRPIAIQMGAAMGGIVPGTASAGVTPGIMASGGLSSITSLLKGLSSGVSGLYGGAASGLRGIGFDSAANFADAQAGIYGQGGMTSLAYGAANLGAGFLGGWAGNKVFGETTGIGSTVGGMAGSVWGPIGTAVGSFIGAGLEKGLGKLFGYGGNNNDGKNVARAQFDFETETFGKGAGSGNSWKKGEGKEQAEFVDRIMEQLVGFGKAIGGSTLKGGISADSRGNLTFNGKAFSDASALLAYGFKEIVAASDRVSDRLKPLVMDFDGSAEEIATFAGGLAALDTQVGGISDSLLFLIQNAKGTAAEIIQFSNAIVSISQQASVNTVTNAIKEFNTVAPTAAAAYRDHTLGLLTQIQAFDGSAESASKLNDMLLENKTAAYEFAMAIQSIGAAIDTAVASQAKDIRESVMTADAKRANWIKERDDLAALLPTLTDPEEINRVVKDALALNSKIFNSLPEAQKLGSADEFAKFAEGLGITAKGLLTGILTELETTQTDINSAIMGMLDTTADKYKQAADTTQDAAAVNSEASDKFAEFVNKLIANLRVNSDGSLETA